MTNCLPRSILKKSATTFSYPCHARYLLHILFKRKDILGTGYCQFMPQELSQSFLYFHWNWHSKGKQVGDKKKKKNPLWFNLLQFQSWETKRISEVGEVGGKYTGRTNTDPELSNLRTFEYKIEIDFLSAFQTAILDQIPNWHRSV